METNSHVVGFFQESVVAYEIITSTGEILNVTAKNDPDLFYAIPWSSGTLGFLVSLTIKIIPIKPYVLIKYVITNSPQELCDKIGVHKGYIYEMTKSVKKKLYAK